MSSVNHVTAIVALLLSAFAASPQTGTPTTPLRTAPTEKFTVNPGFRDWAPTTLAGPTIVGGNSSNRGGLFAVDTTTGKLKWSLRPTGTAHGNPFVSTRPVVVGDIVIAPMGDTVVAVSVTTGKEVWRGPAAAQGAALAVSGGLVFVQGDDNNFHALDASTGREHWKVPFVRGSGSCESEPVVRDGVVYTTGSVLVTPADAIQPASYLRSVFALDAATGKERWRYSSSLAGGICLTQPTITADTLFGITSASLYAITLATGRDRWKPTEVRGPVEGRDRALVVFGLVDAGAELIGLTAGALMAFDKSSGRTTWQIAGQYRENSPSTAVSGRVLYFQGHPGAKPAGTMQGTIVYVGGKPLEQEPALPSGRLNALDLDTHAVLWSFSRPTAEANWPFGFVTPVDGGLWVDSYQALVKLQ